MKNDVEKRPALELSTVIGHSSGSSLYAAKFGTPRTGQKTGARLERGVQFYGERIGTQSPTDSVEALRPTRHCRWVHL